VVLPVFARERLELFAVRLFVADGLNTLAFLSSTMWIVRAGALEGFLGRDDGLTQGRTRGGLLVRVDRSSNGRHIGGVVRITAAGSRITTAVVVRLLIGIHESTLAIAVQSTCKRSFLYLRRSSCRCLTAGDEKIRRDCVLFDVISASEGQWRLNEVKACSCVLLTSFTDVKYLLQRWCLELVGVARFMRNE
jgi:hypothetical protein